jgi:hypothetical protein
VIIEAKSVVVKISLKEIVLTIGWIVFLIASGDKERSLSPIPKPPIARQMELTDKPLGS